MPIPDITHNKHLSRRTSEDARQYVYRVIRACILQFHLLPGQKLNELELSQILNVSRTPVHDTIFRLSREHLADLYPNRGAFVSRMHQDSIEQAIWTHVHMGTSVLQTIHIRNIPRSRIEILYTYLNQMNLCLNKGDTRRGAGYLLEYYHQLYQLAGNLDLVWNALQNVDINLQRLIYLSSGSQSVARAFSYDLTCLTDALIQRDNDLACRIYAQHLDRMLQLIQPLCQHNPEYFSDAV